MFDPEKPRRCRGAWCVCIPFIAAGAVLIFGAVVQWLWNAILPGLLNVAAISYWQAVGLLVLCKILFSGWHGSHHKFHRHWQRHHQWHDADWWMKLPEEERNKIRQEWEKRCCSCGCEPPKSE
jgi:hypothetical protein